MEKEKYQQMTPEEVKKFEEENVTEEQREMSEEREETIDAAVEIKQRENNEALEKVRNIENSIHKWRELPNEAVEDGAREAASEVIEQNRLEIQSVLKDISGKNKNADNFIDDFKYGLKHNLEAIFFRGHLSREDADTLRILRSFAAVVSERGHEYEMEELYRKIINDGKKMMILKMEKIIEEFKEIREIEGAFSIEGTNRYITRDALDGLKEKLERLKRIL